jgi:hypothetical protein
MQFLSARLHQYQIQVIVHHGTQIKDPMIVLRRQSPVQWQDEVVIIQTIMKMLVVLTEIVIETMPNTEWEKGGRITEVTAVTDLIINLTIAEGTITAKTKALDPQNTKQRMEALRVYILMTMNGIVTFTV